MDERVTATAISDGAGDVTSVVPEERPCAMPMQELRARHRRSAPAVHRDGFARLALLCLAASATAAFAGTLYNVLSVQPPTVLQLIFLVLSTVCFAWIAVGSSSALIGFVALLVASPAKPLVTGAPARGEGGAKTALLFPVYHEPPDSVAAGIEAVCRDIMAAGMSDGFDAFVLSDSRDPAARALEARVYLHLRAQMAPHIQIFYRWRAQNTGKKAGNIQEWIERFGGNYSCFVVLDADSLMSADALSHLVAAMEANPRAGLIQTVPRLVGGRTLFARLQQFAASHYGTIVAAGLAAWHGSSGNYWGHNAIIRTKAFADAAGLPPLAGTPPFGGHILSHDFVEAALLRRAGWEVHLLPSLAGSYEGCPPTLGELIVRDRRWAQGNMQHLRLLGTPGLPFLSRLHLMMGALAYILSPIWAATLLVGLVLSLQARFVVPSYFGAGASLFPIWPVFDHRTALALFIVTIAVVYLPKVLGIAWALRNPASRSANGGVVRVVSGCLVECVFSTLVAPILMLTQTGAVMSILRGRDSGWSAQRRAGPAATFGQIAWLHRWHFMVGSATAAICWSISGAVLAWMSPIILGLTLSAPVAMLAGRQPGKLLKRLLETPEGIDPPTIVRRYWACEAEWAAVAAPPRFDASGGAETRMVA